MWSSGWHSITPGEFVWICKIWQSCLLSSTTKRCTEILDSFLAAVGWLCAYFELTCLDWWARYTCFEEEILSGALHLFSYTYLHCLEIFLPLWKHRFLVLIFTFFGVLVFFFFVWFFFFLFWLFFFCFFFLLIIRIWLIK